MEKYKYNSYPLGKVPLDLQRQEIYEIKELGYEWNDPRDIVDIFENELAKFAGSKYAVTVDCCTHAIELSLRYLLHKNKISEGDSILIPNNTYVSVLQTLHQLNLTPSLKNIEWSGLYQIGNTNIYDSAVRFTEGMYIKDSLQCLSFQIKKIIGIGRGGAILCNNKEEYNWLKLASYDGRDLTIPYDDPNHVKMVGYHYYMTPEDCARGLILMNKKPKINEDSATNKNYPPISEIFKPNVKKYSNFKLSNKKLSLELSLFLIKPEYQQFNLLYNKYVINHESISEIAKLLNTTSRERIRSLLNYHNIDIREDISVDLTGRIVGEIKVIRKNGHNKHGSLCWLCECSCGHQYSIESTLLIRNIIKSCHFCSNSGSKNVGWSGCGDISGSYFGSIRAGAKSRNLEFNITIEEIWDKFLKQDKKCALSGVLLYFNKKTNTSEGNASLDRINNLKGYTIDNIQWVHKDINYMKQDYDETYFIEMCKNVAENKN